MPGKVLGETIDLTQTNKNNFNLSGYLLLIGLIVALVLIYLWEKYKLPTPKELIKKHFQT